MNRLFFINLIFIIHKSGICFGLCGEGLEIPEKCGQHNPNGLGGMVSSLQNRSLYSQYAEFPWMMAVTIERHNKDNSVLVSFQSGGSLIHPKVVLTTAHNIAGIDPKKLVVRGGEWDTQSVNEMCAHVERKVEKAIRHEQFTRNNLQNDIALLILQESFELTPFINTICLPPKGSNFDNQRCLASGWGKDKFGKLGIFQTVLKKIDLRIVPHLKCQDMLRKTRLTDNFILHEDFLCAGNW